MADKQPPLTESQNPLIGGLWNFKNRNCDYFL